MCVWQSQAPAGTSKLTGVAGWDAFARHVRGCTRAPVASAPTRRARRVSMGCLLFVISVWVAVSTSASPGALWAAAQAMAHRCARSRAPYGRTLYRRDYRRLEECVCYGKEAYRQRPMYDINGPA